MSVVQRSNDKASPSGITSLLKVMVTWKGMRWVEILRRTLEPWLMGQFVLSSYQWKGEKNFLTLCLLISLHSLPSQSALIQKVSVFFLTQSTQRGTNSVFYVVFPWQLHRQVRCRWSMQKLFPNKLAFIIWAVCLLMCKTPLTYDSSTEIHFSFPR